MERELKEPQLLENSLCKLN